MRGQYSNVNEEIVNKNISQDKDNFFSRSLDALITISLSMIFLGVPLFFLGITYQGIFFEKQIFFYFWTLLALAAWVLKGIIQGKLKIQRTVLDIPLILLAISYFFSSVFSIDRWHSFWGFFNDPSRGFFVAVTLILFYYILVSTINRKRLRIYTGALVIGGLIVTLWSSLAILNVHFLPNQLAKYAPLSLLGSISGLAVYLAAIIPITVAYLVFVNNSEDKKGQKNILRYISNSIFILSILMDLFLLLALYGFANWPATIISAGIFLIFILSLLVKVSSKWTWLPVVTFVAILIILMIGRNGLARVQLPTEIYPLNKLSYEISKNFLKTHNGIKELFLGVGPGNYGYIFSHYVTDDFNKNTGVLYNTRFYQATGIVNESVTNLGLLGVILVILLALDWLGTELYFLFKGNTRNKILSLGLFSGALVLFINAFTAQTTGSLVLLGVILGGLSLAALFLENGIESGVINLSLKTSPQYALVLAFVFTVVTAGVVYLLVFVGKVMAADMQLGLAMKTKDIKPDDLIKKTQRAIMLYNKEGRYYSLLSQEFLGAANQEVAKAGKQINQGALVRYLDGAIQAARKGKQLMPKDIYATEMLAQAYEAGRFYIKNSLSMAEKTYERARELEPHNPDFDLKLGQIKLAKAIQEKDENKRKELVNQAKELFKKSIDKKKDYSLGYYYLSSAEESFGNLDEAIKNMQLAVNLAPNNVDYVFNLGRLYQLRGKGDDNKVAEAIFKKIMGVDDKIINAHFNLALLYDKTNRKKEAIDELKKTKELLPNNNKLMKDRIQKWIDGIKEGKSIEEMEKEAQKQAQEQIQAKTQSEKAQQQPSQPQPQPNENQPQPQPQSQPQPQPQPAENQPQP